MPEWLNPNSKDFWQVCAWCVAIGGGLVAAYKAIQEMKLNREQRARELAWNQAREAAALLDRMENNPRTSDAFRMLDWSGRTYKMPSGQDEAIETKDVLAALRTKNLNFKEKEKFIRDCFDSLFTYLGRVERALVAGLVREEDVKEEIAYYVLRIAKNRMIFQGYVDEYCARSVGALLTRFHEWNALQEQGYSRIPEGKTDSK